MTTNPDARPEPMYVVEHEGETVRMHRAILPRQLLEMEAGYARNTHLVIQIEARVREVGYPEQRSGDTKGELVREHALVVESVALVDTLTSAAATPAVGGSASAAAQGQILQEIDYPADGSTQDCYYDATETLVVHRGACDICVRPPAEGYFPDAGDAEEVAAPAEEEDTTVIPPDILAAIQRAQDIESGKVTSEVGF